MPIQGLEPLPNWATRETRRLVKLLGFNGLFPPQRMALEAGVERGESLLVASPTGSGKSLIAMIAAVNNKSGRAFYLAPLRSIAQEKYAEFKELEKLGLRVRISIGDYQSGPPDADLVIATYEKMDSILRNDPGFSKQVSLVVIDEVHMVGDPKRGPVIEGVVARLLGRSEPQIVALSATVPNADEIASWLGARLVVSKWRPVPLREGVFKDYVIRYADGGERVVVNITGDAVLDLVIDTSGMGGQALVFSQSRRRAASLAKKAASKARGHYYDEGVAREAAEAIRRLEAPRSLRDEVARLVEKGFAYHHAGLPGSIRSIVEDAFRKGGLAAIFSTPTLAAGVNLPARRVIVDEYMRYEQGYFEPIRRAEYKQLAGRAGRPGLDPEGESVIAAKAYDDPEELMDWYIKGQVEPVESRLDSVARLRHLALGVIASGEARSRREVEEVLSKTLYARQKGVPRDYVARVLRDLWEWGLLEGDLTGELSASLVGYTVSRLYLDPENVPVLQEVLGVARRVTDDLALLAVAMSPDMPRLPVSRRENDKIMEALLEKAPDVLEVLDWLGPAEMRAAKTMLVLKSWIEEWSEDKIMEVWGAAPGDLASLADTGEWVASGFSQLAPLLGFNEAESVFKVISRRIKYGVKRELLPLVAIPGVGRVRARRLYEAGYKSIHDLAQASMEDLLRIPGIGLGTARQILEFLGRREEAEAVKRREEVARRGLLAFMEPEASATEEV